MIYPPRMEVRRVPGASKKKKQRQFGVNNCAFSSTHARRVFLVCLLLAVLPGCNMFRGSSAPKRDFPAWCAPQCHGALNEAIAIIEKIGVHKIPNRPSLRVVFVPGQQKFKGGWGWWVPEPSWPNGGEWVGGLTSGNGRLIQMVIDPARSTDPRAVHWPSLVHEMVHYLLIVNGYGGEHLAVYDGVVPGWKAARQIMGKNAVWDVKAAAGQGYRIGRDGTHYDLVRRSGRALWRL